MMWVSWVICDRKHWKVALVTPNGGKMLDKKVSNIKNQATRS
jgi:hypothetical protein